MTRQPKSSARRPAARRQPAHAAADDPPPVKVRKSIQSVETGVRVLDALMSTDLCRAPLREVAQAAEMSRSQAHRYLLAFINTGLVIQDPLSGHYSLGPMALKIGLAAVARLDVVQESANELQTLVDQVGCTGLLSIWGDHGPTVVRWIDGRWPVVTSLNIGSLLPLQISSAGTIFLAFQPPSKVLRLLELERSAGRSLPREEIARKIERARAEGYATASGDLVPGLAAISVPVFDLQGWPAAVLGLIGSSADDSFLSREHIEAAREAARRASVAIGWQPASGAAIAKARDADYVGTLQRRSPRKVG